MLILLCSLAPNAWSAPVGLLSFDQVTPELSVFSIFNLTGGFSLPPDFQVESNLPFENLLLNVTYSSGDSETRSLATALDAGVYSPPEFEFAVAFPILSAFLTGRFGAESATIMGLPRPIVNRNFFALLQAEPGQTLASGSLTAIDADVQIVPEPGSFVLMLCVMAPVGMLVVRKHRRKRAG